MSSKWNRKEEKQAEHPGQLKLDLAPPSRPASEEGEQTQSDTGSTEIKH